MDPTRIGGLLPALALTAATALGQPAGDDDPHADRIRRVEAGLRVRGSDRPLTIDERMKQLGVPGASVAVVDGGEIVWARGYGVREAGKLDPVTPTTRFQAASISKPVAALAALRLVERGRLDLDTPVNDALTTWTLPDSPLDDDRPVTLRLLLAHAAGLGDDFGFPGYDREAPLPTLAQVLDGLPPANTAPRAVRVVARPGERLRYSGGGYVIVQMLIQDATGEPFAAHLRASVLDPLGMAHSAFEQPPGEDTAAESATGHRAGLRALTLGPRVRGGWHVYPEQAAAGLWTTPTDLARVVVAIQHARDGAPDAILSPEMARAMLTPQPGGWGLGVELQGQGEDAIFLHGGRNEGFLCMLTGFVGSGRGAVVMTNSDNGSPLCLEILRSIGVEYGWPEFDY